MHEERTTEHLRAKIAWEGGIEATLEYGLDGNDFEDSKIGAA
jgi:hypothetical protein